ncbi:cupin [Bacillus sp. FJAT-27264]|uniref:cupin domain-containing protein n=1 Tax=Paenibacillus sp. (strain DSM 101736 / FJAT-27264) TaxID=1850362 RepID=UPI000807D1AF|nr:cupin domain-containing protein [Bacillus sp. FJAT-27264]OBZ15578.1 cupin [Bacillus sp. FJAT-27264]
MQKLLLSEAIQYQEGRFTKRTLFQEGESIVFVLNFLPGQQLPSHTHPGTDVYILVLDGTGTVTVDEVDKEVTKGEVIHIGGEETFSFHNSGEIPSSLHVVLCKIPNAAYALNV